MRQGSREKLKQNRFVRILLFITGSRRLFYKLIARSTWLNECQCACTVGNITFLCFNESLQLNGEFAICSTNPPFVHQSLLLIDKGGELGIVKGEGNAGCVIIQHLTINLRTQETILLRSEIGGAAVHCQLMNEANQMKRRDGTTSSYERTKIDPW